MCRSRALFSRLFFIVPENNEELLLFDNDMTTSKKSIYTFAHLLYVGKGTCLMSRLACLSVIILQVNGNAIEPLARNKHNWLFSVLLVQIGK